MRFPGNVEMSGRAGMALGGVEREGGREGGREGRKGGREGGRERRNGREGGKGRERKRH